MKNVYVLEGEVVGNGNIDINGSVKGGRTQQRAPPVDPDINLFPANTPPFFFLFFFFFFWM